jgi:hypothetical protein
MNSKIVKFKMMKLTRRENVDMTDTDVTVSWMLYIDASCTGDQEVERKLM